jgi:hypothetical protein
MQCDICRVTSFVTIGLCQQLVNISSPSVKCPKEANNTFGKCVFHRSADGTALSDNSDGGMLVSTVK